MSTHSRIGDAVISRRRLVIFLVGSLSILFGCYEYVAGGSQVAIIIGAFFSGCGMTINLAQLLFNLPIRSLRRDSKHEGELILPPSYVLQRQSPNLLNRFAQFLLGSPQSRSEIALVLPAYYQSAYYQRARRKKRLLLIVVNGVQTFITFLPVLILFGPPFYNVINGFQTPCTIITKRIVEQNEVVSIGNPPHKAVRTAYALDFTLLPLPSVTRGLSPIRSGSDGHGLYDSMQAAQKRYQHYIVGRTYTCKFSSYLSSLEVISDTPISSSP